MFFCFFNIEKLFIYISTQSPLHEHNSVRRRFAFFTFASTLTTLFTSAFYQLSACFNGFWNIHPTGREPVFIQYPTLLFRIYVRNFILICQTPYSENRKLPFQRTNHKESFERKKEDVNCMNYSHFLHN